MYTDKLKCYDMGIDGTATSLENYDPGHKDELPFYE